MNCPNKPNFQQDISLNELNLHPHFNPRLGYQQQSLLLRTTKIGQSFAFVGEGGFSIMKTIPLSDISFILEPTQFDLTHTLQIEIPSHVFNTRLGIYKDINGVVTSTSSNYDSVNNAFIDDDILLSYQTIVESFDSTHIISLGIFNQLYTNFIGGINRYFGIRATDRQLINELTDGNIDGYLSHFEFYNMLSATRPDDTYYLTGSIRITDCNEILRNAILNNTFNNRSNKTRRDGFLPGDKILFFKGLETTFSMNYNFNFSVPSVTPPDLSQSYYNDASINAIPNLDKSAIGDILFVLT